MSADIPVGAYVASALAAANIPCDSGEDVDRFLHELVKRGYVVSVGQHDAGCELCAEGFKRGRLVGEMEGWADYTDKYDALLVAAVDARYETLGVLADDAKAGTPEAELAERVDAILRVALADAAAPSDGMRDRAGLWEKFTGGEKLAYGMGWRDAERDSAGIANRVATPASAPSDGGLREPDESDPIETFSHPFRAPVAIDGHLFTHTSDCPWPAATPTPAAEPGHKPRLSPDGVCCDEHAAILCGCGNFGDHVSNVDCTPTPAPEP